ncbi:MAG TPA: ABC transporter ATP-binding protein [Actinophytocola sp.]|uniref:ABC transporter ATP-binding protein n=1 Tax=Actinophytocola sp. TaxID=1872138 RepID=UPI002DBE3ECB|nr:ABC transporter ATP-binding protein [Actinophytocola sp.]HEU5470939.1 ABC transporter ATP-binding protein [Actinophytocola sp.]
MVGLERAGPATVLRWAVAAARLGASASPRQLGAVLALTVVDGCLPVAGAWATGVLLDELTAGAAASVRTVVVCAGTLVLAGVLVKAVGAALIYLRGAMHRNIRVTVRIRLFRSVNGYPGLAQFEDPDTLDRIRLAEQAGDTAPEEAIDAGVHLVAAAVTGAGFAATILVLCPWLLAVVVVVAVPAALLQLRLARLRATMITDVSVFQRRQIFFRLLATDVRAAKEVRLFGLGDFITGRMLRDLRSANAAEARVDRIAAWLELVVGLLGAVVTLVGVSAAAYLAIHGRLSVGDVTILLAALVALHAAFGGATDQTANGYRALLLFSHYLAIADRPIPTVGGLVPAPLREGIVFEDVWFRYGADLPWVLRGVSCRLPAGSAVGLVGLNGAGKTTMVKLLCRMYEPQRGRILWDGADIRELDPAGLRTRISAVFQDFMSYDFTAADNIGIGRLGDLGNLERIRESARLAEADAAISALPRGYATLLSRIFPTDEDGDRAASLSGGQWQRIAIARAFLRDDADLLILDEPSSGLDAEVEHALHQKLATLRRGRLSLLISHRLNTLRDADTILVLDAGTLVETGTHDQLMLAGGRYAGLFLLQSQGYERDRAPTQ